MDLGGEQSLPLRLSTLELGNDSEVTYCGLLNGKEVSIFIDSGATHVFTSKKTARECGLLVLDEKFELELGDRSTVELEGISKGTLNVQGLLSNESIYIIPEQEDDEDRRVVVGKRWLRNFNPHIDWETECLHVIRKDGTKWTIKPRGQFAKKRVHFKYISFKKMGKLLRKQKCELFAVRVRPNLEGSTVTPQFQDIVEEFSEIFVDELPNELPPRRGVDFEFNLKSNEPPPVRPVIRLSTDELKELKRQLQLLLDKGLIRPSSSPYGAPVFFVKKKDGALRMVCDYRALNRITIPDSNPLPLIEEALDQLSGAKVFSQIDLIGAYHQMRIREEDCAKTAIRTRFGAFEWRVLCFGLTNAPAAFTRLMSSLLRDLNGECLVLFLDDVLVYSKSVEEHKVHLRRLFEILQKNKLYVKRTKCAIGVDVVDFLGYRVSKEGVHMQQRLIDAILDWPVPTSVKDIQSFLGLSGFYRRFIKNYAGIVRPIQDLVRQKRFQWEDEQANAFRVLKKALTSAPVLAHPSADETFVVSTDASKYAVGAMLEQRGHPVAFLSHRLSKEETNWDTGDQELLAFIIALDKWSVYLRGRRFIFYTDHEPIRYLQSKARLSGRQARWLDVIQEHNFEVRHVPGSKNVVPDALSRRADHVPHLKMMSLQDPGIPEKIKSAYEEDVWSQGMIKCLNGDEEAVDEKIKRQAMNFEHDGDFIFWTGSNENRVYVPETQGIRESIIAGFHDGSHLGTDKTYNSIARSAYWPHLYEDVAKYVASCHDCQSNKTENNRPAGQLQPLEVPVSCWEEVTADFLTKFPKSKRGNDMVLVIVDRLSKRAIFNATKETIDAPEVAVIFQDSLFSKHGVPVAIVSDRDPKFKSKFWRGIAELTNVRLKMSTADHPQTDGQSENMIRTLSNMIRSFIQKFPLDWDTALSQLEFEYNCAKHKSTGLAPFEVELGYVPPNPLARSLAQCNVQCQAAVNFVERREAYKRVARDNIARSRANQKHYADKHRRVVTFNVGDLVMLRTEFLETFKRSNLPAKWRPKFMGPLSVIEVVSPVTYRIELPPSMKKAHNVFHVSKLKPYRRRSAEEGLMDIVVDADGTEEQVVAEILDKKRDKRRVKYLVRFEGEPASEASWHLKADLKNCMDLVRNFERSKDASSRGL